MTRGTVFTILRITDKHRSHDPTQNIISAFSFLFNRTLDISFYKFAFIWFRPAKFLRAKIFSVSPTIPQNICYWTLCLMYYFQFLVIFSYWIKLRECNINIQTERDWNKHVVISDGQSRITILMIKIKNLLLKIMWEWQDWFFMLKL